MSCTQILPLFSKLFLQLFYISTIDKSKVSSVFHTVLLNLKKSFYGTILFFLLYSFCYTVCSLLILYFFTLLKARWNFLPHNAYSLFFRFLLFPLKPLFLFLFWLFICKSFLNVHCVRPLKKIKSVLAYAFTRVREFCISSV